ncbi:MAG: Holliday junction branch migration protein RuvA [Bacteroidales bacterium]|nr:Holliday junction branch migration protein RuvA [Bacteroidales bacterium]
MYSYIEGKITEINPAYVIIETGGIGYMINISLNTFSHIKDKEICRILTHFVVREDAMTLYGFAREEERELFRHLISVSGVGANTARMILSSLTSKEIIEAITTNNVSVLQSVKGIGAKSAQRIIVDLKDKLSKDKNITEIFETSYNTLKEEALSGLLILGFTKNAAVKALDKILKTKSSPFTVEQLIKDALKIL